MRPVLPLALVAALLCAGCARDTYETAYEDVVEARAHDAVDRGWIPDLLPEEAYDLREVHAPRDDTAVVLATLPGGILPDACTEVDDEVGDPPLSPGWLPSEVLARGTAVRCDVWQGRLDGNRVVLWTDRASEADLD